MRKHQLRQSICLAVATTAIFASAACEQTKQSDDQQGTTAQRPVEQAQQESEQAYSKAKEAQEKARSQQQEASKAEQDALKKRDEAARADQKAQQARQQSQQAQQQAREAGEQAQQRASGAQERALQAQQQAEQQAQQQKEQRAQQEQQQAVQQPPQPAPQDQQQQQQQQPQASGRFENEPNMTSTVWGKVQNSTPNEIVVQRNNAPTLHLKVDPQSTRIRKNGQPAQVADLTPGTDVSVSFRIEHDQPVADRIEANRQDQPPPGATVQ